MLIIQVDILPAGWYAIAINDIIKSKSVLKNVIETLERLYIS